MKKRLINSLRVGRVAPRLVFAAACLGAVVTWVDLSPRVEGNFFFADDDPQLVESQRIAQQFPPGSQIIVRAGASDIATRPYREAIETLTTTLNDIDGVAGVTSVHTQDPDGPLWSRILLAPAGDATNLIVETNGRDDPAAVRAIERAVDSFDRPSIDLEISGVPYVLELIRRNLFRDLAVFSTLALVMCAAIVALIYRSAPIVAGTVTACVSASALTLILTRVFGIPIGLLTANLATIVFVLTLSHIVFVTANWQTAHRAAPPGSPVAWAVRETLPASFWCMLTTFLGFTSLLIATARPLRQLGIAGALGTVCAIVIAYSIFPPFLERARPRPSSAKGPRDHPFPGRHAARWVGGYALAVLIAGFGVMRVVTDPSLLSYFADGTPLRDGLEAIDRDAGSSPLSVVVEMPDGTRIDTESGEQQMWALHLALERDPSVGGVISLPLVLREVREAPFMGNRTARQLLDFLRISPFASTARGYVNDDRTRAMFSLRMRESDRREARRTVVERIETTVREHQLRAALVGGLYEQQGELGELIASSLRWGLGGLVVLFALIAYRVSGTARTTAAMVFALAGVPIVVLGTMGYLRLSIDIISSPAANVALAMGVDSMIHLTIRARRVTGGRDRRSAWHVARADLWRPIVSAAAVICAGFGIFAFSTFPPTQRFGLAVILGTLTAAFATLIVLPMAAGMRPQDT